MQKRLVIAEKPSQAQAYAAALGVTERGSGYVEGSGYIISWCFGHLAELADASVYNADYAKWTLKDLPIIPDSYCYTVTPEKRKQFEILKTLLLSDGVSEVVNGCDAGREGEAIFRTVYELAGCAKPIKRLWISSMEENAIREGFQNLRDGHEFDGLYQAALCRARADWLVGINATRFFTLTYGKKLNIGRVMSPTLALLVQREAEISAFVPEPFYTVELDCGFPAVTGRMKEEAEAQRIVAVCTREAVVKSIERKEKSEKPPALYDLTALQREANRVLGYTAQQTLDYMQALYEKKLCTYPRTDSRFLTDDMEDAVPTLFSVACAVAAPEEVSGVNAKQVCDSARVSDHHAIVPTVSAAKEDVSALPLGEREILKLVALAFLRAVAEPYRYAETTVTVECGGYLFTARGKTVLAPGWRIYERIETEKALPELSEGQKLSVRAAAFQEGRTSPAKHYTEDTLLSSMETAGANDMAEDVERRGIGTPATRAGILEKLITSGFVERKKYRKIASLIPTATGTALITVLPEALQSPQLTAEWEQRLKQVERGELHPDVFMEGIKDLLRDMINTYKPVPGAEVLFPLDQEVIGTCPRCGRRVIESSIGYVCESRSCAFILWKNSKFFSAKRQQLTKAVASALLNEGSVRLTGCWSEKTGRFYDATVFLKDDGKNTNYTLEF